LAVNENCGATSTNFSFPNNNCKKGASIANDTKEKMIESKINKK
jgi:hypothetical protein